MGYKGILHNLTDQVQCYRDLLQLARHKRDVLVEGRVRSLDKLIGAEQVLILRARRLEEERLALLEGVAAELNLDPGEITREQLFARLTAAQQDQAGKLEEELQEILTLLQEENRLNQQLIKQSLDYIEFSRGLLTAAAAPLLDEKA